jgi:biopolymer transport protein ExbD
MSFTQREARRIIRKAVARVPEGEEIRHLNIMPMMDMMTILLVAFIYQAAVSAVELEAGTVTLPKTLATEALSKHQTTLIVTRTGISVSTDKAKVIVGVSNGDVDPSDKEGQTSRKIPALTRYLSAIRSEEDAARKREPGFDPTKDQPPPELMIIADRTTPYRLLTEVLFSAKQPEAGYKRFRLVVQKSFPPAPAKP